MFHSRTPALLLATLSLLAASVAHGQIGIEPIPDQTVPSGKTLVIPLVASDQGGPARSYTVSTGTATVSGTTTPTSVAGFTAAIRSGDPHMIVAVAYSDTNTVTESGTTPVITSGTMEFQLFREFAPKATDIISGLTEGGYYNPVTTDGTTQYILFNRITTSIPLQAPPVVQLGAGNGDGRGGPGFTFKTEFSRALIFSGTYGQLAMANGNTNSNSQGVSPDNGDTNGSQYFITVSSDRSDLDYGYTLFGQLIRGYDTLEGVASTPVMTNSNNGEDSEPITPVQITGATVSQNNTDAVLLLSATGVCDAVITVTASSGTSSAFQTFTAHAVADTISDPPFPTAAPPDITSPNGSVKVALEALDLQLDLIRYGYVNFLPASSGGVISGTSPILSIPLISNTDNLIGSEVDAWNGSSRGYEAYPFHAGAGVKPLTGTLTAIPNGSGGVLNLATYPIAYFNSPNPKDTTPAAFTATVNWGDGTPLLSSTGGTATVVKLAPGRFKLVGRHEYQAPGEFPVLVRINDTGGAYLKLDGTANIGPSAIAMASYNIENKGGAVKNQLLATFTDNGPGATPSDYSATINWGDGAVSAGTVKAVRDSTFHVLGSHVYPSADTFTVSTTVVRTGTYSASTWASAHITDVTPSPFPPFPQIHLAQVWSTNIYSDTNSIFTTGSASGGNPFAGLIQGTDGNFYGTTTSGGANGLGTVFQLTSSGTLNTLYSFTGGNDGANPTGALIEGTNGYFYGTTGTDGSGGFGTVYSITSAGSLDTLYSFTGGADGGDPYAGLVTGTDGNFYGTTKTDGGSGFGTVFSLTYSGSLHTLHSFTDGADGGNPYASLITGTDGNLYGTAESGGKGYGTVFSLTYSGSISTLYAFTDGTDGANPYAGVITGTDGNLYGTAESGGANGAGTVYQLSYSGSLNTLYAFTGGSDGANPYAPVLSASDGNLYGTTQSGGNGYGTLYNVSYSGTFNALYAFTGASDGASPYAPVITGSDGNFYGTTEAGGDDNYGTIFQWIPSSGPLNTIYAFTSGTGTQVAIRASVAIVNSGDKPLLSGSATFSAYVDANGTLDGNQTAFSSDGQTVFPIPALQPGDYHIFTFYLYGSVVDTRLKLPLNFNPAGEEIIGVVTYHDPVGDYDGSQKIISPGSF